MNKTKLTAFAAALLAALCISFALTGCSGKDNPAPDKPDDPDDPEQVEIAGGENGWQDGPDTDAGADQGPEVIEPLTDRDGNVYQVIKIGTQYWTASNLRVRNFNDGTAVPLVEDDAQWYDRGENGEAACCTFRNEPDNGETYGLLYNWHAVTSDKLCPEGWHVPTSGEFGLLVDMYGGKEEAGAALKSTSGWKGFGGDENPEYQGDNRSGFTGLPAGYRSGEDGAFLNLGQYGYWWTASEVNELQANCIYVYYNKPFAYTITPPKRGGYSVRCVRY